MSGPCNLPIIINCPECREVVVHPDMFEGSKPISGMCPTCSYRLFFNMKELSNTIVRGFISSYIPSSMSQNSPSASVTITMEDISIGNK